MAATKTLQDALNIYYAILKESENTSAYPTVLATALINQIQSSICSGNLTDLMNGKAQIDKGPLPFLFSDKFYSSVQDVTLDAATTIGAVTLSVSDSSNFATSGKLYINGNIVTYTGNTGTGFTGVTGVAFAHLSGARVSQLFDLPTDFARSVRVIYNSQIALQSVDYRNLYLKLNNYKGNNFNNYSANNSTIDRYPNDIAPFYTIINGLYYLPFQLSNTGYMHHMIYEKEPTELVATTDVLTIPDNYSMVTVPILAAADTLYNRGEEARALELTNFGLGKVMSLYTYYSQQNAEDINGLRVQTGADVYLNL